MSGQQRGARQHTGHRIGAWHGRSKHSDATVARARDLRAQGLGYKRIGAAIGVPWRTEVDWCLYATRYDSGART